MDMEQLLPKLSEDAKPYAERIMEVFDAPYAAHMGVEIESISIDEVVCRMDIQPFMINSMGRMHGGAIYSLIDHTFAIISNMTRDGTGQSIEVKYYRPANSSLRCVAKPINLSKSLGIYDVKVYSDVGKLIASATCTGFVIGRPE
jgi:acyl-CoA thioesterase